MDVIMNTINGLYCPECDDFFVAIEDVDSIKKYNICTYCYENK